MTRPGVRVAVAALLIVAGRDAASTGPSRTAASPLPFVEDFEEGLCTGACPGAHWAIRQEQGGTVAAVAAPSRRGMALRASAGAKRDRVTKADVVARIAPLVPGADVTIGFDLFLPGSTPANSIQLIDLECATCGEGGNPGIRLYLRNGRLRIDRSKIGIAHAWTRDEAPKLAADRWHHVVLWVRIGTGEDGAARVLLDGVEVLAARGATVLTAPGSHADRIQIGVTANSNPVAVILYIDDIYVREAPHARNGATSG